MIRGFQRQLMIRFVSLEIMLIGAGCTTFFKLEPKDSAKTANSAVVASNVAEVKSSRDPIRFSENPNIGSFNEKRYRRVTRKSLEEENDVGSKAGSLWNSEAPGAYLFAENNTHREGDFVKVKLEGSAKDQIDTKINIIKKLLARLEIQKAAKEAAQAAALAAATSTPGAAPPDSSSTLSKQDGAAERAPANDKTTNDIKGDRMNSTPVASASKGVKEKDPDDEVEEPIAVSEIPARVTERMPDGNYRVKGQQTMIIGKKEFKVVLTGLIRPEDFSDQSVSSNKVLESQVDIVSLRRNIE